MEIYRVGLDMTTAEFWTTLNLQFFQKLKQVNFEGYKKMMEIALAQYLFSDLGLYSSKMKMFIF
jgi:hypothetical protein